MIEKTTYYRVLASMGALRLRILNGEWWLRVEGIVNRIPIACSGRGDTPEQAMLNLIQRLQMYGLERQAWTYAMTQYVKKGQEGKSLFEGTLWQLLSPNNEIIIANYGNQVRCMYKDEWTINCRSPLCDTPMDAVMAFADYCVLKDQSWWTCRLNNYFSQQHLKEGSQ